MKSTTKQSADPLVATIESINCLKSATAVLGSQHEHPDDELISVVEEVTLALGQIRYVTVSCPRISWTSSKPTELKKKSIRFESRLKMRGRTSQKFASPRTKEGAGENPSRPREESKQTH